MRGNGLRRDNRFDIKDGDCGALRPTRAERTTCGFNALRGRSRLQLRQRADLHPHARRLGRRLDHLPVAGLRTRVPALRAGTLRRLTFRRPGSTNSPTPRGWTEPRNKFSKVA